MSDRAALLEDHPRRDRSQTMPHVPHRDVFATAPLPTHHEKARMSDLFMNFVGRGRAGSLPENDRPVDAKRQVMRRPRRASHLAGSVGSVGAGAGGGSVSSVQNKPASGRRNSGFQVNPVDVAVFETFERLIHEEHADGHRYSMGSETPLGSSSSLGAMGLPAPPPMRGGKLTGGDDELVLLDKPLADDDFNEPTCLICLGKFSQKRPPVQIPCSTKCNLTPVHARCIYEWKEQRGGSSTSPSGSCPLCRAPLTSLDYIPPDPLATKTLFMHSARRSFVSRPAPKAAGMVRAYIRVVGTGTLTSTPVRYEMYLQAPTTRKYPNVPLPPTYGTAEGDQLLMTARRRTKLSTGSSMIDVSLDRQGKDFSRKGPKLLASVRGSMFGLDYTITAPCRFEFHRESKQTLELGSIRFEQNRVGSGAGPRRISICLPAVRENPEAIHQWPPASPERSMSKKPKDDEDDDEDEEDEEETKEEVYETIEYTPQSKKESLRRLVRRQPPVSAVPLVNGPITQVAGAAASSTTPPAGQFIYARNRKPYYLESISAFSLDFFGRVTLPSNKNCLLTCDDSNSSSAGPESNILLFGKIGVKGRNADAAVYTLDFQWPLSPLQAFCIALASCDRKFGCA